MVVQRGMLTFLDHTRIGFRLGFRCHKQDMGYGHIGVIYLALFLPAWLTGNWV